MFEQQLESGLAACGRKTRVKVLDFVANSKRIEMVEAGVASGDENTSGAADAGAQA